MAEAVPKECLVIPFLHTQLFCKCYLSAMRFAQVKEDL